MTTHDDEQGAPPSATAEELLLAQLERSCQELLDAWAAGGHADISDQWRLCQAAQALLAALAVRR